MTDKNKLKEVVDFISRVSISMGNERIEIDKLTRLYEDLGFVKSLRRELAMPINKIFFKRSERRISKKEAGDLETVEDIFNIVVKK